MIYFDCYVKYVCDDERNKYFQKYIKATSSTEATFGSRGRGRGRGAALVKFPRELQEMVW
jgi:hypothetical protein